MMKEEIKKLKKAFRTYNLDYREEIPFSILKYIKERVEVNKAEIDKLIDIYKIGIKFDDIVNVITNEQNKQEPHGRTVINQQGFMFSQILSPIGTVAVEAFEPLEIIKYWIKAIKSRNALAISSVDYNEQSIEAFILVIIKEALLKYKLDENLVMYMPFEECFYEYFDRTIYTYDKRGDLLEKTKVEEKDSNKEYSEKMYVYLEDKFFQEEAEKNENAEILTDEMSEILEKIKHCKCATIYTQSSEKAFEFINLADCKNVFVNTNVENAINTLVSDDALYKYKNIIIPIPREVLDSKIKEENESITELENKTMEQTLESISNKQKENVQLVKYKESLWEKLKRRFRFLKK